MARRREISYHELEDVYVPEHRQLWEEVSSSKHISHLCDDPGIIGLLWREVKRMIRWASRPERGKHRLTEWQVTVLEAYFLGNLDEETARTFNCTHQNVNKTRLLALEKIKRYKPDERGLLTVMCETFPWPAIREHLADLAEEWINRQ